VTNDRDLPVERPDLRVGDADREAAVERLQAATADGRLGLDELDDRLAAAYAARTHADLERVTADLPELRRAATRPLYLQTRSGSHKRVGEWVVPAQIVAECTSGTIKLDFTEAICSHREITVQATATSGSIIMIVPPGWSVMMDDVSTTSGSVVNKVLQRPDPAAPRLTVIGQSRSGTIKARYRRRTFWEWLRRRPH
jgi:hypothetical protein